MVVNYNNEIETLDGVITGTIAGIGTAIAALFKGIKSVRRKRRLREISEKQEKVEAENLKRRIKYLKDLQIRLKIVSKLKSQTQLKPKLESNVINYKIPVIKKNNKFPMIITIGLLGVFFFFRGKK